MALGECFFSGFSGSTIIQEMVAVSQQRSLFLNSMKVQHLMEIWFITYNKENIAIDKQIWRKLNVYIFQSSVCADHPMQQVFSF